MRSDNVIVTVSWPSQVMNLGLQPGTVWEERVTTAVLTAATVVSTFPVLAKLSPPDLAGLQSLQEQGTSFAYHLKVSVSVDFSGYSGILLDLARAVVKLDSAQEAD